MNKKGIIIIFILNLFLNFSTNSFAVNKQEAESLISELQNKLNLVHENKELKQYVPFDVYNDIVLLLISAGIQIRERDYNMAYYHGQVASIKLETLNTLTEANRYEDMTKQLNMQRAREKYTPKEEKTRPLSIADIPLTPIMNANLLRKGSTFRIELLDKDLFETRTFKLSKKGKNQLTKIITALNSYPDSKVQIVGHTRWEDYKKHSKWKSKVVYNYFTDNGIDQDRASYLGVGNRVVMDTPWGYRRINRVEIVIYGVEPDKK